ncbi:hypothetical protein L6452_12034 [Arctium lappa]|uniref:Uncharacterized protein n=1 Tax=Arctium lappa TaxID=4217 RepID=A0ACB9DQI4_ARCLA|nr:hypothetical protein L6452_12034 [Arctium lappa]
MWIRRSFALFWFCFFTLNYKRLLEHCYILEFLFFFILNIVYLVEMLQEGSRCSSIPLKNEKSRCICRRRIV